MNTNRNFSAGSDGSILLLVLVIAIIIGAATFALLQYANAGLVAQRVEKDSAQALANAFSGLEIAQNVIDAEALKSDAYRDCVDPYTGREEERLVFLWEKDPTANDQPGESPIVHIVPNEVSTLDVTVTVSYLGYSWDELRSSATLNRGTRDEITREVWLRVRERDYLRYGTFVASQNEVTVEDNAYYYGSIHANNKINYEDFMSGLGAKLFGLATSVNKFTFRGNAEEETWFEIPPVDGLGKAGYIPMPELSLNTLKSATLCYTAPYGSSIYSNINPQVEFRKAEVGGVLCGFSIVGNVDTKITFKNDPPANAGKVEIEIWSGGMKLYSTGNVDVPQEVVIDGDEQGGVIHVGGSITAIKGEVNGCVTVCSERNINISGDLLYEDDNDQKAMIFDPANPAPDNYLPNANYTGNSVLGLFAKSNILYTGSEKTNPLDPNYLNLEVNAAMISGLDGQGAIKYGASVDKQGYLRTLGSRLSNGKIEPCSSGHGYMLGAVYVFDKKGCKNPGPQFPEFLKPYYTGWEIVK